MSISSSVYLCSSCASCFDGAVSEVRSPVRVITSRGRRKRERRAIRTRKEEIRDFRGYVSCSASGRGQEEISESGPVEGASDDVITFFLDGSSSRGHSNSALESVARSNMASSNTNRSSMPFASVTSTVSTTESKPFMDRLEDFDKLNWKGKVTVSAVVVAGLAAASFAGVKLARGLHGGVRSLGSKKGGGNEGGGGGGGGSLAYDVVAKGFSTVQSNLGPWSFSDLTLGLAAISKVSLPSFVRM